MSRRVLRWAYARGLLGTGAGSHFPLLDAMPAKTAGDAGGSSRASRDKRPSLRDFLLTSSPLATRHSRMGNLPLPGPALAGLMDQERPQNLPRLIRPHGPFDPICQSFPQIDRTGVLSQFRRAGRIVGIPSGAFPMHDRIAYQGITFDDVLLEPGYSDLLPARGRHPVAAHRPDRPEYPDPLLADGHRHRGRAGHRAGPGGRARRHPQEHVDRGADPRGRQGQAVGERDHRRPDHAAARRYRRRGAARS